jgi:hypothetical protein
MDDKTRIRILKGLLLASASVATFNTVQAIRIAKQIEQVEEDNRKLKRAALIASKIIQKFAELGDEETCAKIMEMYEFDWVVKDIEL